MTNVVALEEIASVLVNFSLTRGVTSTSLPGGYELVEYDTFPTFDATTAAELGYFPGMKRFVFRPSVFVQDEDRKGRVRDWLLQKMNEHLALFETIPGTNTRTYELALKKEDLVPPVRFSVHTLDS